MLPMSTQQPLVIGLFGFGVVGEGLYKVLQQTPSLQARIKKVCIKNPDKKRAAPDSLFTTRKEDILDDPEINVVVEVINESDAAFEIVTVALQRKKSVVSASKKMIAEHLEALLLLQQETGTPMLYESAACASIPVIRNLEEYYDNDLLHSIRAIVNGSTNFILTKMFEERLDFSDALLLAQQLGFADLPQQQLQRPVDGTIRLLCIHGRVFVSFVYGRPPERRSTHSVDKARASNKSTQALSHSELSLISSF